MKMNWGHGITIVFILFAGIIITMVTISMKQDVNLVAVDYYEEEIAYQDQIERIKNFNNLAQKPTIIKEGKLIILSFPESLANQIESGELHFFRPSDSKVDKKYKIKLEEGFSQSFPTSEFGSGLWRAKLKWKTEDKEYFTEQRIVI